jgi:acyl carrier protein
VYGNKIMSPDRQAIETDLLNFVRARGRFHATVALETDLLESGLLDSLSLTDFILHMEQTFGVQFDGGDINPQNFQTVSAAVSLLLNRLSSVSEIPLATCKTPRACTAA